MDYGNLETREVYYYTKLAKKVGVQSMEGRGWKMERSEFVPFKPGENFFNFLLMGLGARVREGGKAGYIKVTYSKEMNSEENQTSGSTAGVVEWFNSLSRWLSYAIVSAVAAVVFIILSTVFEDDFWPSLIGFGLLAPALWVEILIYGLDGSGESSLFMYLLVSGMSWFLIGGGIGKLISMPVFDNMSENNKLYLSVLVMMGLILVGSISMVLMGGG